MHIVKDSFDVFLAVLATVEVVVGLVFYPACLFFIYKIYRVAIGKPETPSASDAIEDGRDIVARATRKATPKKATK